MDMKSSFERDMNHNYLVIEKETFFEWEENDNDYRERMVLENKIAGLIPMEKRRMNGRTKYYYDINQMQTLECLYEKKEMTYEELFSILQGCTKLFHHLEEYLLEGEQIVLDPTHIYIDMETGRPYFLYVLFYEKDIRSSFLDFTDYLLTKIDHTQEKTVMLGYQVYKYTRTPNFTIESIGEIMKKYDLQKQETFREKQEENIEKIDSNKCYDIEEEVKEVIENDHIEPKDLKVTLQEKESYRKKKALMWMSMMFSVCGIITYILVYYLQLIVLPKSARLYFFAGIMICFAISVLCMISIWKEQKNEEEQNSIEDNSYFHTDLEEEGTVCLKDQMEQHYFEGIVNGHKQKIFLNQFPLTIGKQDNDSDIALQDNTVSRKHAKLEQRQGKIYISDLHSTNGTKKNGVYLQEHKLTELLSGDEVTFGGTSLTYV